MLNMVRFKVIDFTGLNDNNYNLTYLTIYINYMLIMLLHLIYIYSNFQIEDQKKERINKK